MIHVLYLVKQECVAVARLRNLESKPRHKYTSNWVTVSIQSAFLLSEVTGI
jgi:hypothetical protein